MGKCISRVVIVSIFVGIFCFFSVGKVNAQTNPLNPYGGRSYYTYYCDCTPGCWWVLVGNPVPGSFLYCPEITTLYSYYSIWEPAWQLGLAQGSMSCMAEEDDDCVTIANPKLMLINGTSLE